jgi:3-oxoacyl-[acyl-carrier protein] reductase
MNLELADKVVMVTGASSGIGKATAVAFAGEGASVVVGYRTNAEGAAATAAEAQAAGGRALAVQPDLGDEESIAAVVQRVGREWATIDVLVNNAVEWPGFPPPGELFETAPAARMRRSLRPISKERICSAVPWSPVCEATGGAASCTSRPDSSRTACPPARRT